MPDDILADVECMEIMRDCALVIANFRHRMTVHEAAARTGLNHSTIRAAIEGGELEAIDVSKAGSGTGKNRAYRVAYMALADYCRRRTRRAEQLPS